MKGPPRRAAVTKVWRPSASIARLATPRAIAYADIGVLFDDRGRLRELDTLPPEIACTVESVTRRRWPDGRKMLQVKLRDRAKARTEMSDRHAPMDGLRTTKKQRGGVTGRGFVPGQSGNHGGRGRGRW
jgi:hypothetical protein